jgi:tRNA (cytidine/uridine-2'-O-)-methyltransferase
MSANAGARLHLVRPIAFDLSEKAVRRAGMDYAELAHVEQWDSLGQCLTALNSPRWFAISTRGVNRYDQPQFAAGDAFVFGPETRGLPQEILELCEAQRRLRIPMRPDNRSLNLSNAVAVVTYEAWRQLGFEGAEKT